MTTIPDLGVFFAFFFSSFDSVGSFPSKNKRPIEQIDGPILQSRPSCIFGRRGWPDKLKYYYNSIASRLLLGFQLDKLGQTA